MKRESKPMSHGLTCRYMQTDGSGEPAGHCRPGMKYDRHGRLDCTIKAGNISGRTSVHDRPEEVDGRCFGDRETDTTTGRNGKGAILTLTEQSTNFILMAKIKIAHAAKTAIRLSLPYMGDGVKTITADNGGGFSAHGKITEAMKETAVCFANPCSAWQKDATKERRQTHKAIRAGMHGLQQPRQFLPRKSTGQERNSISQHRNANSSNISSDFAPAN